MEYIDCQEQSEKCKGRNTIFKNTIFKNNLKIYCVSSGVKAGPSHFESLQNRSTEKMKPSVGVVDAFTVKTFREDSDAM